MPQVSYTALDGGSVQLSAEVSLNSPPTSIVVATVGEREHEFTSGAPWFGQSVADEFGVDLAEEYSFQGGRLSLGEALQVDPLDGRESVFKLAVWEGEMFSLETGYYEGDLGFLIALLDMFTIAESGGGISISPVNPAATPLASRGGKQPQLLKWVGGLGLLEIWQRTSEGDAELPPWEGASVAGGELFHEMDMAGQPVYLLVGDDAITRIYGDKEATSSKMLEATEGLSAHWTAG